MLVIDDHLIGKGSLNLLILFRSSDESVMSIAEQLSRRTSVASERQRKSPRARKISVSENKRNQSSNKDASDSEDDFTLSQSGRLDFYHSVTAFIEQLSTRATQGCSESNFSIFKCLSKVLESKDNVPR